MAYLVAHKASCGFPSPAEDFLEANLNLHEYIVTHPAATFFVRAGGESMIDVGIYDGSILVVDRSLTAKHGSIVIALLNNEFCVKKLTLKPHLKLCSANAKHRDIELDTFDELQIWGVVTNVINNVEI